jgi:hypothetical protein
MYIFQKAAVEAKRSTHAKAIHFRNWRVWPYPAFLGSYPSTTRLYLPYISTYLCTLFYALFISVTRFSVGPLLAYISVFKVDLFSYLDIYPNHVWIWIRIWIWSHECTHTSSVMNIGTYWIFYMWNVVGDRKELETMWNVVGDQKDTR